MSNNDQEYNPYTNWRFYVVLCYLLPAMGIAQVVYGFYLVKDYLKRTFK